MRTMENIFSKYAEDLERYLLSKLPEDTPTHVAQEIAAYITNRTSCMITDVLLERDHMWERQIRRGKHWSYRSTKTEENPYETSDN